MPKPSMICRGKNLHLATMKQFCLALPRQPMPKNKFFDYAEARMTGFKQTHSQIARQMGLYYCDSSNVCHPRFTQEISLDQILEYSRYWAEHYFVPNPYTPSFPAACTPTCVYGYVVANCKNNGGDLEKILSSMFNQPVNEIDKVRAYLLQFTGVVEDNDGHIVCNQLPPVSVDVGLNRDDELAYFHYFDRWESMQDYRDEFIRWWRDIVKKPQ